MCIFSCRRSNQMHIFVGKHNLTTLSSKDDREGRRKEPALLPMPKALVSPTGTPLWPAVGCSGIKAPSRAAPSDVLHRAASSPETKTDGRYPSHGCHERMAHLLRSWYGPLRQRTIKKRPCGSTGTFSIFRAGKDQRSTRPGSAGQRMPSSRGTAGGSSPSTLTRMNRPLDCARKQTPS